MKHLYVGESPSTTLTNCPNMQHTDGCCLARPRPRPCLLQRHTTQQAHLDIRHTTHHPPPGLAGWFAGSQLPPHAPSSSSPRGDTPPGGHKSTAGIAGRPDGAAANSLHLRPGGNGAPPTRMALRPLKAKTVVASGFPLALNPPGTDQASRATVFQLSSARCVPWVLLGRRPWANPIPLSPAFLVSWQSLLAPGPRHF